MYFYAHPIQLSCACVGRPCSTPGKKRGLLPAKGQESSTALCWPWRWNTIFQVLHITLLRSTPVPLCEMKNDLCCKTKSGLMILFLSTTFAVSGKFHSSGFQKIPWQLSMQTGVCCWSWKFLVINGVFSRVLVMHTALCQITGLQACLSNGKNWVHHPAAKWFSLCHWQTWFLPKPSFSTSSCCLCKWPTVAV